MLTKRPIINKLLNICLFSALFSTSGLNASPNKLSPDAQVVVAKPKLSKPIVQIAKPLPQLTKARKNKLQATGEKVPGLDLIREVPNRNHPFAARHLQQKGQSSKDGALQTKPVSSFKSLSAPIIGTGFDGMGNVQGAVPPDTNADVGPNHIVQMVNTAIAVWDKQGNQLLAPVAINTIWDGFGGLCESTNRGDPIVLYDGMSDRWLISQFAFNDSFTDNHQCIAISQTGDPTGSYYLYDFLWSTKKFNDYPHFGLWHDGYYAGVNQFTGDKYSGAGVVVYEREKMLLGQPAQQIKFDLENSKPDAFTPMPADIDGIHLPPSTMPQYFVSAGGAADTIDVWTFTTDWDTPGNSAFVLNKTLKVAAYKGGVCEFDRNCIVQPASQRLDAIGQRMMFRLAYRNLLGTQHKLVANHTVVGSDTDNNIAGVRWYEFDIDAATGTPSVANQGTYSLADGNSRWMGSAAMDAVGNIGVAYSISGPSLAPSIRFTGRYKGDAADTLTVPETELIAGGGSQSGANRWGDYSSLSIDPSDDCTMWYTTEYYKAANNNTTAWSTYIGSFKFEDCVAGPAGKIVGTVIDADSNTAIEGVEVSSGTFRVYTNEQGQYVLHLPEDTGYQISYFKYGWVKQQISSVDIAEGQVVEQDMELSGASSITVTGTVKDGSGLNSPLYSEIIANVPGGSLSTFTNPLTGEYSINLFGGTLVKLTTNVQDKGYLNYSVDIDPAVSATQHFNLLIDQSCSASGYKIDGLIEGFESGVPPQGWTTDTETNGSVWASTADVRGNLIGSSGEAAIADSDATGEGITTDTSLVSPVISVTSLPSQTLEFDTLYRPLGDVFDVDINVDGAGWTNLFKVPGNNIAEHHTIDMSAQLNGAQSFQLRWHYYDASWNWYALIDNVKITGSQCTPDAGSFVFGYVTDANTQEPLVGASISTESSQIYSVATPDDVNVADGYFKLFINNSSAPNISVAKEQYSTKEVTSGDISLTTPIALDAGKIDVPAQFDAFEVPKGTARESTISISNSGNVDTDVDFFVAAIPTNKKIVEQINGPFHPSTRHFGPKALTEIDTSKIRYRSDFTSRNIAQSQMDYVSRFSIPLTYPFGIVINQTNGNYWVGDVKAGGASKDEAHQFDPQGVATRKMIDTTAISGDFAADMTFNNRTGMLWQVEVGNENCIHELNPVDFTLTGEKICPEFGTSQRGLAYDPITDTYYSGSWNDSIIHQFKPDGTILRSVNVQILVSGLALNPVTGSLFVMANDSEPAKDVVVLNTNTDNLDPITSFDFPKDIDLDGDNTPDDSLANLTQGGIAIDCNGTLWAPSRSHKVVIGITSGETGVCSWANLPWLLLTSGYNASIAANSSQDVSIRFNAEELEVGAYKAQLIISANTPYDDSNSTITLNVVEPNTGKVEFEVANIEISEESEATFLVNRSDGSDQSISVQYKTKDGTAVAGVDYTATEGTLTWEDSDTEPKEIKVPILAVHQNKSFSIELSSTDPDLLKVNTTLAVTIKDQPKGSGSLGFLLILLLALPYLRKKL
ncbi:Calx-beta domain-containing protein [Aliikangiella sp. IMCC44359]|uniref:Calx-beta domain-containing protein n=1 Tax=Aliikangiella sp. IMCC44359 TaxID=3459125 RepID=UPI00403AE3C8